MRLLLDSYALIEFFKGSKKGEKVKKLIEKSSGVFTSVLCIYEVGYRIEQDYSKEVRDDYLRSLKTHYIILNIEENTAIRAIELKKLYKLPSIDCLIYASARINKAKVVSGCPHFRAISKQRDIIIV